MNTINSFEVVFDNIHASYKNCNSERFIVLIGGCSRSGKSTMASKLTKRFLDNRIDAILVSLDSWLVSVDNRRDCSTVSERYDLKEINKNIGVLISGQTISLPFYDPVTRKRLNGGSLPIGIKKGIIIVEGVVALADHELLQKSNVKIFLDIPDSLRIKRLLHFYKNVKNVKKPDYKKIISEREVEEIPFIKKTSLNADMIFCWPN